MECKSRVAGATLIELGHQSGCESGELSPVVRWMQRKIHLLKAREHYWRQGSYQVTRRMRACGGPKEWSTRVGRQVIDRDRSRNTMGPQRDHTGERRADLLRNVRENGDYRVIQGLNCSSRSRRSATDSASRRSGNLPTRTRKLAPDVVTNAG